MNAFRNLEIGPADPVETWGVEGVLAAIDRGGLAQWRRIIRAVQADPDGVVAQDLTEALELAEDVGVAAMLGRVLERARLSDAERMGLRIRGWVEQSRLPRSEIARRIGTSRSRLCTYETGRVVPSAVTAEKIRRLAARRRDELA